MFVSLLCGFNCFSFRILFCKITCQWPLASKCPYLYFTNWSLPCQKSFNIVFNHRVLHPTNGAIDLARPIGFRRRKIEELVDALPQNVCIHSSNIRGSSNVSVHNAHTSANDILIQIRSSTPMLLQRVIS